VLGQRGEAGLAHAVGDRVLAGGREEAAVHPLGLHPQHHHRVDRGQLRVESVRHGHRPALHPRGQQRGRSDQNDLGAERGEQVNVGAGDPAVQHVADDRDPLAVEPAETLPQGGRVEQGLGGVLVRAVARVDHRGAGFG
jgi:hypothetical protein